MDHRRREYVLLGALALVLAGLVTGTGLARELEPGLEPDCEPTTEILVPTQGRGVSLQEAINIATAQHPGGRVVRASTVNEGGRRVHVIRIVLPAEQGGRVVTIRIDAGGA